MTDDKGPDKEEADDNSWMCCSDGALMKESLRGLWFSESQPQLIVAPHKYNETFIIYVGTLSHCSGKNSTRHKQSQT